MGYGSRQTAAAAAATTTTPMATTNYDCYYNYCCYHCSGLLDIVGFFGNEITFPQNGAVEGLRA